MYIYTIPMSKRREQPEYPNAKFPFFSLQENDWNDHGYVTSFFLRYHSSKSNVVDIGGVKILHRSDSKTILGKKFRKLGDDYCSQGQASDYYENLMDLGEGLATDFLEALNDIIYRPLLAEPFKEQESFQVSLLRNTSAQKVFKEGKKYFDKRNTKDRSYQFTFICKLKEAAKPHQVGFDFRKKGELPHRLMVLIGKNGTGKTRILAEIANALTQRSKSSLFKPESPSYSKVFAVSYSLFDKFHHADKESAFGYRYCGLRTKDGYANDNEFLKSLSQSLKEIKKLNRMPEWRTVVEPIVPEFATLVASKRNLTTKDLQRLSSGQIISLSTLTDIVANIQTDSLLLFDEPETHLHPNAISSMIKSIHRILEAFRSYAIISTHSPIVLQEVPARSVQVFSRDGNYPNVQPLSIESFGENLTTITHEVFGVDISSSLYKSILRELSETHSKEQILRSFDDKLGFNARVFLESIYQSRDRIDR